MNEGLVESLVKQLEAKYKDGLYEQGILQFKAEVYLDVAWNRKSIYLYGKVPFNWNEEAMRKEFKEWQEDLVKSINYYISILPKFMSKKFDSSIKVAYYEQLTYKRGKFTDEEGEKHSLVDIWDLIISEINHIVTDLTAQFEDKYKSDLEQVRQGNFIVRKQKLSVVKVFSKAFLENMTLEEADELITFQLEYAIEQLREASVPYLQTLQNVPLSLEEIKTALMQTHSANMVFPKVS